jgi:hypothetical protein
MPKQFMRDGFVRQTLRDAVIFGVVGMARFE